MELQAQTTLSAFVLEITPCWTSRGCIHLHCMKPASRLRNHQPHPNTSARAGTGATSTKSWLSGSGGWELHPEPTKGQPGPVGAPPPPTSRQQGLHRREEQPRAECGRGQQGRVRKPSLTCAELGGRGAIRHRRVLPGMTNTLSESGIGISSDSSDALTWKNQQMSGTKTF